MSIDDPRSVALHEAAHAVIAKSISGRPAAALLFTREAGSDEKSIGGNAIFDTRDMTNRQKAMVALAGECASIALIGAEMDHDSIAIEIIEIIGSGDLSETDTELAGQNAEDFIDDAIRAVIAHKQEIQHVASLLIDQYADQRCAAVTV